MNQSILFSDQLAWNDELAMVEFQAHQSGMLIVCLVGVGKLAELSNTESVDKAKALEVFEQVRFDIEELAESLIEDEAFDEQGRIVLD